MHFLVFQSKRLSYDSSWCFMEMLRRGLRQLGAEVTVFALEEDIESQGKELMSLCSMDFDGIFDVNSILPSVKNDREYYLNCFDAPFYQLIVDHPMHVHPSLMAPLKNHVVICLDRQHRDYLKKEYPHLKEVYYMPFAGIPAGEFLMGEMPQAGSGADGFPVKKQDVSQVVPMEARPYNILFPGTYTPLDYCWQQMNAHGDSFCEIAEEILREYRKGSKEAIDVLYREKTCSDTDFFAMKMYKARFVDRYIRQWYREQVLGALLRQKVTVDVVGMRWEMYQGEGREYLRIHKPCSYAGQLSMLAQSKLVLNVQPLFQDGPHDRVMNAMANRSVPVTDSCRFLEEHFTHGRELYLYDRNQPETMAEWVRRALEDTAMLAGMAENAFRSASGEHTWYSRAAALWNNIRAGAGEGGLAQSGKQENIRKI